jgi:hypothetical protein
MVQFIDKSINQEHRLNAYESFLNDDLNSDEYSCNEFEGELLFMPDVSNMRFKI